MRTAVEKFLLTEEGVTAIEFAALAPVLCLLLMGIIEFSLVMLTSNLMESATNMSARLGKTGFVANGYTREQTIINAINQQAGSLVDTSRITITSKSYAQYDNIADPEPFTDTNHNGVRDAGEPFTDTNHNGVWDADQGTVGYGNTGDVVVYSVSYPWHISTPLINQFFTNGTVTITSHAVVKNEPY